MELSDQETEMAKEAAKAYFSSLNDTEKVQMGVTEEVIAGLYAEYALANKVYQFIIRDINPEISDDEARTITVQHGAPQPAETPDSHMDTANTARCRLTLFLLFHPFSFSFFLSQSTSS